MDEAPRCRQEHRAGRSTGDDTAADDDGAGGNAASEIAEDDRAPGTAGIEVDGMNGPGTGNARSGETGQKPAGGPQGIFGLYSGTWQPLLLTYVLYLVCFKLGLMLALPGGISPVWPASGLALAMVLQFGNRVSVAIFAAGLTGQLLWSHLEVPFWLACVIPFGAAIEPLIGGYLLRRFSAFDTALPRFRDVVSLILLGAPIGTLLNSLYTVAALAAAGVVSWPQYTTTVTIFWFGNTGGVLMLSTAVLVWLQSTPGKGFTSAMLIETGIILALLSMIILGLPRVVLFQPPASQDPVAFLCFPLIAWASLRLDLRLSTLITLLVAAETIVAARLGAGAFSAAGPDTALFIIQLFILSLNITNQLLGALARQKDNAEELLHDREEFLTMAVHGGNDGLFDYRRPSRSLWLSPRWKAQLGYDDDELANRVETWEQVVLPEDREKARAQFEAIDRNSATQSEAVMRYRHKKGHVVHILSRLSVRRDASGRVARLVGTHTDISALMNARDELEHQTASLTRLARDLNLQRREAEAANEAKSAFLATVSHEVRTPLNGVIGMISLLLDTQLEADQQRYADTALASAEELLIIINSILDVSKLEAGRLSLDIIDCDFPALIEGIVALFSARATSKGISLSAEIAGNVPRIVRSDPTRLRQILMNLVGNAVKFTPAGDVVIRVNCAPMTRIANPAGDLTPSRRHYLLIDVVDTGIGIAPTQMDRLFDRFRQADDTITRRFGGTGLGLTISKQLIELMGGQISVDSKLGVGSTFHIVVPCALGSTASDHRAVLRPEGLPTLPPCHVLVVEDNAINSALVTEMLTRLGHRVTTAENGAAALSAVARDTFDVILMDVQMPEVDGVTATQWIRDLGDSRAHTPIIALTADTMTGSRERFLTAGFSDYLEKPVRAAKLLETIARHLQIPTDDNTGRSEPIDVDGVKIDESTLATLRQVQGEIGFKQILAARTSGIEHDLRRLRTAIDLNDYDTCHSALQSMAENAVAVGAVGLADLVHRLLAVDGSVETVFVALPQLQTTIEGIITKLRNVDSVSGDVDTRPEAVQ